jgi:hypothetical protein
VVLDDKMRKDKTLLSNCNEPGEKRLKNGRLYSEKTVAKMGQRTLVCNREISSNLQ